MSRLQWLNDRRKGLGGSDAAAILGASKFKNEWDVFFDKSGVKPVEDNSDQFHLLLGRLLEPVVAKLYEIKTGNVVIEPPGLLVHPEHDCIIGTPDRLVVGQPRGIECKTANAWSRTQWGEPGSDQVPDEYLIQSQHYLGLTNYDIWDVPVLFSGTRFEIFTVPNDKDFIAWMYDRLQTWWKLRIVQGVRPDIDASQGCSDYIRARFPRNDGNILPAPDHAVEIAQRLDHLRSKLDVIETENTTIENTIKDLIGDADGIEGLFGRVTWKKTKDGTVTDWQAVAKALMQDKPIEAQEAIVAENTKPKPGYRRFYFKPATPTTGDKQDE